MTRAEELLQKFLAGELSEAEQAEFEQLQRQSPEFAREVAEYRRLLQLLEEEAQQTKRESRSAAVIDTTYKRVAAAIVAGIGTSTVAGALMGSSGSSIFSSLLMWISGGILTLTVGSLVLWNVFIRPHTFVHPPTLNVITDTVTTAANDTTVVPTTELLEVAVPDSVPAMPVIEDKRSEVEPFLPSDPDPAELRQPEPLQWLALAPTIDTAGERAMQRYFRAQLIQWQNDGDTDRYIQTALRLADSYVLTADYRAAQQLLEQIRRLPAAAEPEVIAQIALLASRIERYQENYAAADRYLIDALAAVTSSVWRGRLLAERAFVLYLQQQYAEALAIAQQGIQQLEPTDPLRQQLQQLINALRP